MVSTIKFDLNDLQRVVTEAAAKSGGREREEYTKTSFLPKGSHDLSFFFDPEKHIFRDVHYHKFDKNKVKCLCPNQLNYENKKNPKWAEVVQGLKPEWADQKLTKLPACEICSLNSKVKDLDKEKFGDAKKGRGWKLKLGQQYSSLMYVALYTTSNQGQYWQPNEEKGAPYVIIGSKTLKETLTGMLEEYGKKAGSYAIKAVNPTISSPPFTVINNENGITITVVPQDEKPAIIQSDANPPAWWRPLNEVFLGKEFSLSDYEANVEAAKKLFEDYRTSLEGVGSAPAGNKVSSAGDVESFLADNTAGASTAVETRSKDQIEHPKPLTPTEEKLETTGQMKPNQRLTKMGETVELPDYAVERNCWGNFKGSDRLCAECPVNLECNFEQD